MWNPFRKPEPDPLLLQLLATLQEQQASQARLIEKVIEQSAKQAETSQMMVKEIMDLWKPQRSPVASSMDERALAKEAEQLEWDPIPVNIFEQLDRDIGIPVDFLSDHS